MKFVGLENMESRYVVVLESELREHFFIRISGDDMRMIYAAQQREAQAQKQETR